MPLLQLRFDRAPRFVLLLVSILVELMVAPLFVGSEFVLHAAQFLASLVMVAALWAADARATSIILFVPTVTLHLLSVYWGGTSLAAMAIALRAVFFGYTTGLIVWRTLRHSEVTIDTLAGAACAYTLLAVVWGNFYMLLELLQPGSFHIPTDWLMGGAHGNPGPALAYFSFITLTTVGYGDITPVGPGAGGLVAAEAIVGQLYLAITIARLVGLHASQRNE